MALEAARQGRTDIIVLPGFNQIPEEKHAEFAVRESLFYYPSKIHLTYRHWCYNGVPTYMYLQTVYVEGGDFEYKLCI